LSHNKVIVESVSVPTGDIRFLGESMLWEYRKESGQIKIKNATIHVNGLLDFLFITIVVCLNLGKLEQI
jgi:hypothetical protein